jgi:hypothetical protein
MVIADYGVLVFSDLFDFRLTVVVPHVNPHLVQNPQFTLRAFLPREPTL